MKLKVLSNYANRDVSYQQGALIEVDTEYAHFLISDAPGCFKLYEPEPKPDPEPEVKAKAIEAAPKTTMVKRAKVTK